MLLRELAVQPPGNFGYTCKSSRKPPGHKGEISACSLHQEKGIQDQLQDCNQPDPAWGNAAWGCRLCLGTIRDLLQQGDRSRPLTEMGGVGLRKIIVISLIRKLPRPRQIPHRHTRPSLLLRWQLKEPGTTKHRALFHFPSYSLSPAPPQFFSCWIVSCL